MNNVLSLNSKAQPKNLKSKDTDDYNPLEAAKFESEFSKYFGPYQSPAKLYKECAEYGEKLAKFYDSEESQ